MVYDFEHEVVGLPWTFDDGGREAAGFRGRTGDCVVRSIAIAGQLDYREVYEAMYGLQRERFEILTAKGKRAPKPSPRNGVNPKVWKPWLLERGWIWTPTMSIGSGTTVHLRPGELPDGRLIVRCSRHITTVIDGIVHDTYDPCRDGTRAVYGYYRKD